MSSLHAVNRNRQAAKSVRKTVINIFLQFLVIYSTSKKFQNKYSFCRKRLHIICVVNSRIPAESQPFVFEQGVRCAVEHHVHAHFDIEHEHIYDLLIDLDHSRMFAFRRGGGDPTFYDVGVILVFFAKTRVVRYGRIIGYVALRKIGDSIAEIEEFIAEIGMVDGIGNEFVHQPFDWNGA